MARFSSVTVVGLGYIGLPTAAVIASYGLKVLGVDINEEVVETINRGAIHIQENDLDGLVHKVVSAGKLVASTEIAAADVFIIAVPTPFHENKVPDMQCVEAAARAVAAVLKKGNLVILESTSPVGTSERLAGWLAGERVDLRFPQDAGDEADVQVAHCPERVLPGRILHEIITNDRVVGGISTHCAKRAAEFYGLFVTGEIHLTDVRTAELVKLSENAYRDTNIAFANELSLIADKVGVDVWRLIELTNRHPRVNILKPGPGVGGHCIAVDPWFIVSAAPDEARLIRMAREVNDAKPASVVAKVVTAARNLESPVIVCLGLAFKADIDDIRESPAVEIVTALAERKIGRVIAVEPYIDALPDHLGELGIELSALDEALRVADIVVGLVDHRAFKSAGGKRIDGKIVIDTRGTLR